MRVRNADGDIKHVRSTGEGTEGDPFQAVIAVLGRLLQGEVGTSEPGVKLSVIREANLSEPDVEDGDMIDLVANALGKLYVTLEGTTVSVQPASSFNVQTAARTDVVYDGVEAVDPEHAIIAVAGNVTDEVVEAVSGKRIKVLNYMFTVGDSLTTVQWGSTDTAGANVRTGVHRFGANGGAAPGEAPLGHFVTAVGASLVMTTTGAAVAGHLTYAVVD